MSNAMDVSKGDPSTNQTHDRDAPQAGQITKHLDLGPDLKPSPLLNRGKSIFVYAIKNYLIQIIIMALILFALGFAILNWDVLLMPVHPQNTDAIPPATPSNWADWWMRVQSFLGMGTLIVALFVWYSRIRDNWEDNLPKRMSVFFFFLGKPVIICRYVWLASEDDLRAWGQQVAAQAADTERRLEFSPEIKTRNPELIISTEERTICRHYEICFQLNALPPSLTEESGMCRYQNFASKDNRVHPVPQEMVAVLSEVSNWQMGGGCDCVSPDKPEK
jgi:hypothetical protein